ncbi:MAG TPA: hypothetical protein VKR55_16110 [Bradyrhizobium sp.]|uniref:hypothetical protein n=1 Tax=Bradyrhizobium sp. TaxID=376 RepID=UPI002C123522|nr:hypothetical protein [Bradyrhizobium sp.]HLZ03657.1 hypothetical protein [Bradyrhizobium sp.]
MKMLLILGVALSVGLATSAFSQGMGMGSNHSSPTGGAFGSNGATPGTNSLGTALSSSGHGARQKGALLGTGNPAVDREDKRVKQIVRSICRGC